MKYKVTIVIVKEETHEIECPTENDAFFQMKVMCKEKGGCPTESSIEEMS